MSYSDEICDQAELENHHPSLNGFCESSLPVDCQEVLAEIRRVVHKLGGSTEGVDDATLMRFLTARSMHTDKAGKMFVDYQKWRESFVPKGFIPDEEVSSELAMNKVFLQGSCKVGWPVVIIFLYKHQPSKQNFEKFKRFIVHALDKSLASAPPKVDKLLTIVDLNHFGYKNLDIKAFITCFQILQNYYPERLGRLYMINPSQLFLNAWKLISRFVDKATKDKINFLGCHETSEVLLTEMDQSVLPAIYGGRAELLSLQDVHIPNGCQYKKDSGS